MAGRKPSLSPELRDRVLGMFARGETVRGIEATLRAEGIVVSDSTISRAVSGANVVNTTTRPIPKPSPPLVPSHVEPRAEEPEHEATLRPTLSTEDPRELARADWLYYEQLKLELRARAESELRQKNLRGYRDLLREARIAEERATELRPPVPPDPAKDPSYLASARDLTTYVAALVERAEQGRAMPERTLPPLQPIAA
jgi:hypothetical protein